MFDWLFALPALLMGILVVGTFVGVALAGLVVARRFFAEHHMEQHNDVAGFIYAALGVVYAVLLAFVTIGIWEKFDNTEGVVETEASSAGSLYRLVQAWPREEQMSLRNHLYKYAHLVIEDEWPRMPNGGSSELARAEYNGIWDDIRGLKIHTPEQDHWYSEMVVRLNDLAENRRVRLTRYTPTVQPILWFVLLFGAALTIGYTYLYGVKNLTAQMLMTGALTATVAIVIFLVMVLDHPYGGDVAVHPVGFERELQSFDRQLAAQGLERPH